MVGATKKNPHITQDILNMEFAFIYQDASKISETQDLASILTGHTCLFKVVIWDTDKNQHKMLKIQQIFPKLYRCLLYVVFHNLEPQNAGLVDVKRG